MKGIAVEHERIAQARDRLRQLRVFCETARLESMSGAADSLSLSQPAVSRQIRALEEELSTALFERRGPRIFLTPPGRRLRELAAPLVEAVDRLPNVFAEDVSDNVTGKIRIASGMTGAVFLLPDPISRYRLLYPGVQVRVDTKGGADSLQLVQDREADFGIGAMEFPSEDLEFHPVLSSMHVLIVPLDHPLADNETASAEDLGRYPCILPVPGTYTRVAAETVARYVDVKLDIALETAGWSVIKRYVEAGLGMAAVPDLCVSATDRVRKIPFDEHLNSYVRPRVYGVILRRNAVLSLAATRFIEMLDPDFPGTDPEKPGQGRGASSAGARSGPQPPQPSPVRSAARRTTAARKALPPGRPAATAGVEGGGRRPVAGRPARSRPARATAPRRGRSCARSAGCLRCGRARVRAARRRSAGQARTAGSRRRRGA